MKKLLTSMVLVCLAIAIAMPLSAQDKKKKKKKGANNRSYVVTFVKKVTDKGVELTDEQSAKIKKLQDETGPKIIEANKVIGKKRRELNAARKKVDAIVAGGGASQLAAAVKNVPATVDASTSVDAALADELGAATREFVKNPGDLSAVDSQVPTDTRGAVFE